MAEYIDRNLLGEVVDSHGNVHYENIMNTPTADVIERSKIDKAIEEMEIEYNNLEYVENYNREASYGIRKSIEILKRNIGE